MEESLYRKEEEDALYLETVKSQLFTFIQMPYINCSEFDKLKGEKKENVRVIVCININMG